MYTADEIYLDNDGQLSVQYVTHTQKTDDELLAPELRTLHGKFTGDMEKVYYFSSVYPYLYGHYTAGACILPWCYALKGNRPQARERSRCRFDNCIMAQSYAVKRRQ